MMKTIVVLTTLLVLMMISQDIMQQNPEIGTAGYNEYGVVIPADNMVTYSRNGDAEYETLIRESEFSEGLQNSSPVMASYMSGKLVADVFMVF